jgi:hypothetical protein
MRSRRKDNANKIAAVEDEESIIGVQFLDFKDVNGPDSGLF